MTTKMTTMKWESARKYLHPADAARIKMIARKGKYSLSRKPIEAVFRMVLHSGKYTSEEFADLERYFEW